MGFSAINRTKTDTQCHDLGTEGGEDRLDRRREAVIATADRLFLQQGFERTTLADVVEGAGGSLATLYKLFGNKLGLLEAVMERRSASKEGWLQDLIGSGGTPLEVLETLSRDVAQRFLDPAEVALSRVVMAYSLENPDFGRRFHDRTIATARAQFSRLFTAWAERGHVLTASPDTLAAMFIGMFVYDLHSLAISHGAWPAPDIDARVRVFCTGAGLC